MTINKCVHPDYVSQWLDWDKWRLSWYGGDQYVEKYLYKYSSREDNNDFNSRKTLTPPCMFATTRILDIANAIYDRMFEIRRDSKSKSYTTCSSGLSRGVDLNNSTMNYFIGVKVLQELLFMGKVGVYVDMPNVHASNYFESKKLRPYLYYYKTENIRAWSHNQYDGKLDSLVLRDSIDNTSASEFNVVTETTLRYRHYLRTPDGVLLTLYDKDDVLIESTLLSIQEIPFVIFELPHSLMSYVADYQIALMNIESSDLNFIIKANFPLYVEMYDPKIEMSMSTIKQIQKDPNSTTQGSATGTQTDYERQVGSQKGIRFPFIQGMEYPTYITPPGDCIKLSMEKQQQIKNEIIMLLNKSVAMLKANRTSAESKQEDTTHEEQGLNYIGLELHRGEIEVERLWSLYESITTPATIIYPTVYTLKNDDTRIAEASNLIKLNNAVPSETYRKELTKRVARTLFMGKIDNETLKKIYEEVDASTGPVDIDYKAIETDVTIGILSPETASSLRGYPEGEVEKAAKAHAERAARILLAQQSVANKGSTDLADDPQDTSLTKDSNKDPTTDPTPTGPKVRGEGE